MKKILSISLFLFMVTMTLGQEYRIGLHFSPNTTWAKVDKDFENTSSKIQYSWGVRMERNFSDRNYGYFGGIDLSKKGAKVEVKDDNGNVYDMNYSAQYIEIPLAIKMTTRPIGQFSYWLNIGLSPNLKISEDVTIESENVDYTFDDSKNYISSFNMSLFVGGGIQYELTEGTDLIGGIQYNNGFTNNINKDELPGSYSSKISFNSFGLFIGVLF